MLIPFDVWNRCIVSSSRFLWVEMLTQWIQYRLMIRLYQHRITLPVSSLHISGRAVASLLAKAPVNPMKSMIAPNRLTPNPTTKPGWSASHLSGVTTGLAYMLQIQSDVDIGSTWVLRKPILARLVRHPLYVWHQFNVERGRDATYSSKDGIICVALEIWPWAVVRAIEVWADWPYHFLPSVVGIVDYSLCMYACCAPEKLTMDCGDEYECLGCVRLSLNVI
jgi:hypothetical protein